MCHNNCSNRHQWWLCRSGETLLHRMIDLLCCFPNKDHPIRLNRELHLYVSWLQQFLSLWNGVGFWLFPGMTTTADIHVKSDATGSIGYIWRLLPGPFTLWPLDQQPKPLSQLLFQVAVAAHLWGSQRSKRRVLFLSDNKMLSCYLEHPRSLH